MYLKDICITGQRHKRFGFVCRVSCGVWQLDTDDCHVACISEGKEGHSHTYSYVGARLMTQAVGEYFEGNKNELLCLKSIELQKIREDILKLWEQKILTHYNELSPAKIKETDTRKIVRRYLAECIIGLFCGKQLYVIKTKNMDLFYSQKDKIMDYQGEHVLEWQCPKEKSDYLEWDMGQIELNNTQYVFLCSKGVVSAFANRFRLFYFLKTLHTPKCTDIKKIESLSAIGAEDDIGVILWRNM